MNHVITKPSKHETVGLRFHPAIRPLVLDGGLVTHVDTHALYKHSPTKVCTTVVEKSIKIYIQTMKIIKISFSE